MYVKAQDMRPHTVHRQNLKKKNEIKTQTS